MTEKTATARFGAGKITMVDRLIDEVSGSVRRARQEASHTLAGMLADDPNALGDKLPAVAEAMIDALFRPEAQTRWEALDALRYIADVDPSLVEDSYEGAEASLFDENNSRVRVSAFCLIARMGSKSLDAAEKVWPLLDEAIQCYHGDLGYRDMLAGMLEFVQGEASDEIKSALAERIRFDAENGRGFVRDRSAEIIAIVDGK